MGRRAKPRYIVAEVVSEDEIAKTVEKTLADNDIDATVDVSIDDSGDDEDDDESDDKNDNPFAKKDSRRKRASFELSEIEIACRARPKKEVMARTKKTANQAFTMVDGEELRLGFDSTDGHWIVTGLDSAGRMEGVVAQGWADSFHDAVNAADTAVTEWAGIPGAVLGWSVSRVTASSRPTNRRRHAAARTKFLTSSRKSRKDNSMNREQRIAQARRRAVAKRRRQAEDAKVENPSRFEGESVDGIDVRPDDTIDVEVVENTPGPEDLKTETEVQTLDDAKKSRIERLRRRALNRRRATEVDNPSRFEGENVDGVDVTPDDITDVEDIDSEPFDDSIDKMKDTPVPDSLTVLPGKASAVQVSRLADLSVQVGIVSETDKFAKMEELGKMSAKEAESQIRLLTEVASVKEAQTKRVEASTAADPFRSPATPNFGRRSTASSDSGDDMDLLLGL